MKALVTLSAAVLVLAACSESPTTPVSGDYALREGRPVSDPGIIVTGTATNDFYDFESGTFAAVSGESFFSVDDLDVGGFSAASPNIVSAFNGITDFIGRVDNHSIFLTVTNPGTEYSLAFDLYIIGSWDGQGKQAQQGSFGQDIWRAAIRCGTPNSTAARILLETDFSNQLTVQQSYPEAASQKSGNKAGTGSYATDLLGFKDDPSVHTPLFRSFGDIEYHLSFTGINPCATGQDMIFTFTVPDAGLQSNRDESWGLDNVAIKTD